MTVSQSRDRLFAEVGIDGDTFTHWRIFTPAIKGKVGLFLSTLPSLLFSLPLSHVHGILTIK